MRTLPLFLLAVAALCGAEKFGKGLTLAESTPVETILRTPDAYIGKMVQVKGKVAEVCQMMGCWLQIQDGEKTMRMKVKDGEIMFPKNGAGRRVIAEGVLKKIELNQTQAQAWAKHEAEERGQKFDPAKIKSGMTMYQIQGTGAVLLD
ncbi:MAG TPA: DUF4920 domain-containing protein [Bryobacteraceae bacterium]|nr:DUF4920 domain-containing protein [Bryobacteraceae bacterium]